MDFSTLTEEELLDKYNGLKEKLVSIFTDVDFLASSNKDPWPGIIKKIAVLQTVNAKESFRDFTTEYLYRQFRNLSMVHFIYMEKSSDFGAMGEQRVSISFCRNILKIPANREVTQFDADRFRKTIDEYDEKLGKKNAAFYENYLKKYNIDLYGKSIPLHSADGINKYLEKLELGYGLFTTFIKGMVGFIFCETKTLAIDKYVIKIADRELARAPTEVLSIAARNHANETIIRRESCEVIFFNKWQRFYDQSKAERKKALMHKNSAVREGIKEKALSFYGAKTSKEVEAIKKTFIDEMIDGIVWHEIGHKVGEGKLDPVMRTMGNYFTETDTIVNVLKEALADWGPHEGDLRGAFARFLQVAEKEPAKATRDIYVYLSDNWFIDEEEEFMCLQTEILTALTLHFINPDGSVDFKRLDKEMNQIIAFLLKSFATVMQRIETIMKTTDYKAGMHILKFENLEEEAYKLYKSSANARSLAELRVYSNYWVNMFGFLKKFAPEAYSRMYTELNDLGSSIKLVLLKNISKNDPGKYNNSLREYIFARYKEIGVLKEAKTVDYARAVAGACEAMKMPAAVASKVKAQFDKIYKGENFDISINYEGEKDPFIAVVQEMMLKTGYGDIKAGMVVGEMFNTADPPEKRKEYIKNELENIRDQLESEMYLEVDQLKVNQNMNVKPMVEELLESITFFDSKRLKDKVKEAVYTDTSSNALMEVFIPLKRGYMDWNTSQAVWRVNQDLRPDEFIMQWTIDKEFLDSLVESYQL